MGRPRKKAQGLGDTIEQITEATGIKKVVKALFGDDCGCDERKEKLNKLFPYNKIECLEESEYNTLTQIIVKGKMTFSPSEQMQLLKVYNRVFNVKQQPTNCNSCWREIIKRLDKLVEQYKNEMNESN
jgi:hypothetical protein